MPRTFTSPNGFTILVGKNKHDNDHTTFELGKPHDFWFHAEGIAGSHVVMQWDPSHSEPSMEDFECAASYAAFYSKARDTPATTVPVSISKVGDVEKPKRSPPGRVMCNNSYVIYGKPGIVGSGSGSGSSTSQITSFVPTCCIS